MPAPEHAADGCLSFELSPRRSTPRLLLQTGRACPTAFGGRSEAPVAGSSLRVRRGRAGASGGRPLAFASLSSASGMAPQAEPQAPRGRAMPSFLIASATEARPAKSGGFSWREAAGNLAAGAPPRPPPATAAQPSPPAAARSRPRPSPRRGASRALALAAALCWRRRRRRRRRAAQRPRLCVRARRRQPPPPLPLPPLPPQAPPPAAPWRRRCTR